MERAYQQGYEDAQTGRHSFSENVSDNPYEPVAVPASHLSSRSADLLQSIGRMQVGPRIRPSAVQEQDEELMLDDQVRAFFHQERGLSDYRRKAPDWQLRYKTRYDNEVLTYGSPVADRTVQVLLKAGLLEPGQSESPALRDQNFLILSPKGKATYLAMFVNR